MSDLPHCPSCGTLADRHCISPACNVFYCLADGCHRLFTTTPERTSEYPGARLQ